jgi:DNA-binding GntR family transcriptional regulator
MNIEKPKKLLSETAYQSILDSLFNMEIPVGSKLSQKDLVRVTGTAIGPIRDALKVLEADGIVKIHPRSGVEVVKPSTDLIKSTFQFRTIIERAAARQFAMNAPSIEIEQLRELHLSALEDIRNSGQKADVSDMTKEYEDAFHSGMVRSLKNELIETSFRRLHLMARVIRLSSFVSAKAAEVTLLEHLEVLEACSNRDADKAEEIVARHLLNALSRNLGLQ